MKRFLATLPSLLATFVFVLSAQGADESPAVKAHFVDRNDPAVKDVLRYGINAINRVGVSLVREVNTAMAQGGPEGAVDVCHLKGLPLVNGLVAGMPRITALKRTSFKVRNPANRPDEADQLALDQVKYLLDHGDEVPPLLVQRVEPAAGNPEWRVYKPVAVMPQCLACHGDPAGQPAGLRAKLTELYPEDQAVGYNTGDWRGLIRVTVADE